MNILIVYSDPLCSCTVKCTYEQSKSLNLVKNCKCNTLSYLNLEESHFIDNDIIIFQRIGGNNAFVSEDWFQKIQNIVKKYKSRVITIYQIDDLLINTNPYIAKFCEITDYVMISNATISSYFSQYNENILTMDTFIDSERCDTVQPKLLPSNNFKLFWASTGLLGYEFMLELIPTVLKKMKNVSIYVMGGRETAEQSKYLKKLAKKHNNLHYMSLQSYEKFVSYFKACDVYLNPISYSTDLIRGVSSIDFLNAKSPIKYVHAGYFKKPFLSTKGYYGYDCAVIHKFNGYLLENNVNTWIDTLKKLQSNEKLRKRISKDAYENVLDNYTLEVHGRRLYDELSKLQPKFNKKELDQNDAVVYEIKKDIDLDKSLNTLIEESLVKISEQVRHIKELLSLFNNKTS